MYFHGQLWILKGQEIVECPNVLSMNYHGCGQPHVCVVICTCVKTQQNAVWLQVSRVQVPEASGERKNRVLRRFLFEMWSGRDMSWLQSQTQMLARLFPNSFSGCWPQRWWLLRQIRLWNCQRIPVCCLSFVAELYSIYWDCNNHLCLE